MTENFRVGVVTSTHGVHGEVKVFPTTDEPARFKKIREVKVDTPDGTKILNIQGVKFFKQMVILKLEGIDRMEDAGALKGKDLYVPREDAVELYEDEYYIADLIGLNVISDDGHTLGTISDVLQTGANDVYEVSGGKGQLLIPAIKDCVLDVDTAGGTMTVHLLGGMED